MKFYLRFCVNTRYEKDGKVVEFDSFEEADAASDKLSEEMDFSFWPDSDDPRNKEDSLSQPLESIEIISKAGESDENES